MKILITGGSGFVGSHVADRLLKRGDQVLVVDNFATGRRDNLKSNPNLEIVEGTIANEELVEKLFNKFKPEIVVHAAASYKDPENWLEDSRTNALGTAIIVKACEKIKIRRLIYFQTALCYGINPSKQPIPIDLPLNPQASSYAISKTAGEYYIRLSNMDYISFRLANAYGPRNMSGPPPTFFHRLTNKKSCFVMDTRRDYIFIKDLVDIVEQAITGSGKRGIYHVSSGSDYSIEELFNSVVDALDIELGEKVEVRPRNPDDAYTILLDPSKTNKDFGWKATTPLNEGIQMAINYYKIFGIEQTFTHLKQITD